MQAAKKYLVRIHPPRDRWRPFFTMLPGGILGLFSVDEMAGGVTIALRKPMYRIVSAILVGVATLLFIRGTQIDRQIWKVAESRKALLEHYVDHTRTLTPRDIEEKRFWSNYGDYPEKFSFYYFLGAIFVVSLTQLSNKLCARQKKLA